MIGSSVVPLVHVIHPVLEPNQMGEISSGKRTKQLERSYYISGFNIISLLTECRVQLTGFELQRWQIVVAFSATSTVANERTATNGQDTAASSPEALLRRAFSAISTKIYIYQKNVYLINRTRSRIERQTQLLLTRNIDIFAQALLTAHAVRNTDGLDTRHRLSSRVAFPP